VEGYTLPIVPPAARAVRTAVMLRQLVALGRRGRGYTSWVVCLFRRVVWCLRVVDLLHSLVAWGWWVSGCTSTFLCLVHREVRRLREGG